MEEALRSYLKWRQAVQPRRQDVLGDFTGRELCVIHGESMLVYCLEKAKVDFDDGFQLLHLVHAVESFLNKLQSRRCNFNILWFDDHESLLLPRPNITNNEIDPEKMRIWATNLQKRRLARAVLMRHLEHYCLKAKPPMDICFRFSSMDSQEFESYRKQRPVRLFFISDGSTFAEQHVFGGRMTFESVIYRLATIGYTVALVDDVEFKSSEARATLYSATPGIPFDPAFWKPVPILKTKLDADPMLINQAQALYEEAAKKIHSGFPSLREATSIVSLALILKQDESMETQQRAVAFLAHLAIIKHCPLATRPAGKGRDLTQEDATSNRYFMARFCDAATAILTFGKTSSFNNTETWDIYDLVDGRIWANAMQTLPDIHLPSECFVSFRNLHGLLSEVSGVVLSSALAPNTQIPLATTTPTQITTTHDGGHDGGSLLPFSQPDFESLLKDVAVDTASHGENRHDNEPTSTFGSRPFKEDSHWHSTRKVSTKPGQSVTQGAWAEKKAMRRDQERRARMVAYAASLTNAIGKVLEPETIVTAKPVEPGGSSNSSRGKTAAQLAQYKQQFSKNVSKRTEIIQQQEKQAQHAERAKVVADWRSKFVRLQKEDGLLKRYRLISDYITRLPPSATQVVGPDAHLLACCILGEQLSKVDSDAEEIELKALVWRHLQDLRKLPLTAKLSESATIVSTRMSFDISFSAASSASSPKINVQADQPFLSGASVTALLKGLKRPKSPTTVSSTNFQLESCGPYMEKGFDSQADPRVSNFEPDAWQREVLDTIDRRDSLVVVAPTSAGKTFISFYAMKQVLKESDDGVLVYVAPTKALCNQVAADVQARFNKSYPQMMGAKSVWAINTRDYRVNNSVKCQVLVTVPQMLQNLLLSPSNSGDSGNNPWTSRLKWIIFDEVHSIGQSEEGVVWEQLLLMAPCPIIALSATVGNLDELKHWLEGCEEDKGRKLRMIVHSARYSDLRCYYWTPQAEFKFGGFSPTQRWPTPGLGPDGYNLDCPFDAIHPVATLMDRSRDTLDDISFESRDCLTLWESMNKHQSEAYPLDPALDPSVFFQEPDIVKATTVKWEAALRQVLLQWLRYHDSPFLKVQAELSPVLGNGNALQDERYGTKRTLQLLVDLQKRDALPALVFLYDRGGCNQSVKEIVEQLGAFEKQWKDTSPVWAKTMAAFEKYKKGAEAARKKAAKPSKKARGGRRGDDDDGDGPSSKLDSLRETASQDAHEFDHFDPDAPLDRFSLAKKVSKTELEEYIEKIKYLKLEDYLFEGLRRGVAVHHSGMNRAYLQTVEILFRKAFLAAVVATGTLALGINMPCKTVVFSTDSTFLTALNFRQGAGRAGRRGFDILGNVVFYDITPQRTKEIMALRLSDLRGHFPISTSLVLRISTLLHLTDRCKYARQCLKSLFSQTRIYLGGPEGKEAIKHHLRFSIEYLRRHHLLSVNGAPINFSGLVTHLHYTENSIFAFHALLEAGYFHKLCSSLHKDEPGVLSTLVLVMAHLFNRMPCRRYNDQTWLEHTVKPSSSVVLLPQLPDEAETILRGHNQSTLSIFRTYVQTYVRQHLSDKPDDTLPFTHQKIAPDTPADYRPYTYSGEGDAEEVHPVELRSPFAALSGFTDDFATVQELCSTVRAGVFLDESSVPYMAIYPTDTDGMPLNAYIYDFFRNGDLNALVKANGIKDGDVWYLLQDFTLALKTIAASLANFIDPSSTAVDDLMNDLSLSDEEEEEEDHYEGAPDTTIFSAQRGDARAGQSSAAQATAVPKKAKKAKVVDSWDDSESEDEDEGGEKDSENPPVKPPSVFASNTGPSASSMPSEQGLRMVLSAFKKLSSQFDEKFHKIWA